MQGTHVEIWMRNTGVGPARARAANVSHQGVVLADWAALLRTLQVDASNITRLQDIMQRGRVSTAADDEATKRVDCTSVPRSAI